MPSIQINSPANGSSVPANTNVDVNVTWDGLLQVKPKKGKKRSTAESYTITCTGSTDLNTSDSAGTTTFTVNSGSGGPTMITVSLFQNPSAFPLATASVTLNPQGAGTLPGTIGVPNPISGGERVRGSRKMYICGTCAATVKTIVCVTYRVEVGKAVPFDGNPASTKFTISYRLRKIKQYSTYKGNLVMGDGTWQATVKADICDPNDAYQIQVWFMDRDLGVLGTGSASVANVAQASPCA